MRFRPPCAANRPDGPADPIGHEDAVARALVARLGRHHYSSILKIGCGTAPLNVELARRADRFLMLDRSAAAVTQARKFLLSRPQARVRQASPQHWPRRNFDLVVLSELPLGMTRFEPRLLARRCAASLSECGEIVVLCAGRDDRMQRPGPAEAFLSEFRKFREMTTVWHPDLCAYMHQTLSAAPSAGANEAPANEAIA
ncbi:class I SAM-dependent methyltransferase [Paracoccus ravus]|uniref:methyltransferase domain-containing protein n=1 Tax=Paracoccus ravus TaxID=2447760 RepID=UPI00142F975A|nr:class I SAM-dependent methyltransferase [Paracoccus ravus]